MEDSIIKVINLTKAHEQGQISGVYQINFDIKKGEILAVIGESGSGKSTLLKSIYGLLSIDEGEILYNDKRVKGPDEQLIPGHPEMKMVTQDFSLNIYAKVYDNIASMLSNTDIALKKQKTEDIMSHLHISSLRNKRVVDLSGGEQQRVAIARALVSDTKLLLLDEPFAHVDAILRNQLRTDLKNLAKSLDLTIVLVSHDATDGLFLADRLLIIRDGRLLQIDTPRAMYNHPKHIYTAKLLGNAVVLSADQAKLFGFNCNKEFFCFYPEWLYLENTNSNSDYLVEEVYFKGFYEEVLISQNGVSIRAIQSSEGGFQKNDRVKFNLSRFLEF